MPINLVSSLRRLLDNLERAYESRLNVCNNVIAHKHSNSTKCDKLCSNLPYQERNMDICGLACLIPAIMFTQNSDLSKKESSWVTRLDENSSYLRRFFICCYIRNSIDFELFRKKTNDKENCITSDIIVERDSHEENCVLVSELEIKESEKNAFLSGVHTCDKSEPKDNADVNAGEANHKPVVEAPDEIFKVGKRFSSFYEVKEAINDFENSNGIQIRIYNSSTLNASKKKPPKRIMMANSLLEHFYINLCCKFSGVSQERERIRRTSSMRQSCPFYIGLGLSTDGQYLEVKKFVNNHNDHIISNEFLKHLTRQRALNEEEKEFAKKAFLLKGNKKIIQQQFLTQGKKVTLKDLSNLQQQCKVENGNEIKHLMKDLSDRSGSTVELVVNENNEFGALFYQDNYMNEMYEMYPELIMVDARNVQTT